MMRPQGGRLMFVDWLKAKALFFRGEEVTPEDFLEFGRERSEGRIKESQIHFDSKTDGTVLALD